MCQHSTQLSCLQQQVQPVHSTTLLALELITASHKAFTALWTD